MGKFAASHSLSAYTYVFAYIHALLRYQLVRCRKWFYTKGVTFIASNI
jgi:hypothetical protein